MTFQGHLFLEELTLAPATEWAARFVGWCFLRLQQGQGYWLDAEGAVSLGTGDVLALAPARCGALRASQLGSVTLHYFRFCPELLGGLFTLAERQRLETLAAALPRSLVHLAADTPEAGRFAEVSQQSQTGLSLRLRCRMLEVALSVLEPQMERPAPDRRGFLSGSRRIRLFLSQLTEAELLDRSSRHLAAQCGCSVRHFNRLFVESFGLSLRAKQTELRLLRAGQWLTETRAPIRQIAAACGFRQPGVFQTLFKRRFGVTPTVWRAQAWSRGRAGGAAAS